VHIPQFLIYYDSVEMSKTTKINLSASLPLPFTAPNEVAWPHAAYNDDHMLLTMMTTFMAEYLTTLRLEK
jgi:hypothetical protein